MSNAALSFAPGSVPRSVTVPLSHRNPRDAIGAEPFAGLKLYPTTWEALLIPRAMLKLYPGRTPKSVIVPLLHTNPWPKPAVDVLPLKPTTWPASLTSWA